MSRSRFLALAGLMLAASVVSAPFAAAQVPTPADFAAKATVSNLFEIESSRLAESRAKRADVKAFAHKMVADHTKATAKMKPAAAADRVVGNLPTRLDAAHQAQIDQLVAASGDAFDTAYVSAQKAAHDEAVALFSAYAGSGPQGALKSFAAETLPVLKEHQAHVGHLSPKP